MKRHLIPGARDRHGVAHPWSRYGDPTNSWPRCTGACQQGRTACTCDTELANTHAPSVDLVVSRPTVRWQTSGGRIPRGRRLRRAVRALWDFLMAPRCDL